MRKGRYENLSEGVKWAIGIGIAAILWVLAGLFTKIPISIVALSTLTMGFAYIVVYIAVRAAVIDVKRSELEELKNVAATQCPWYNRRFGPRAETCRKCAVASTCETKSKEVTDADN